MKKKIVEFYEKRAKKGEYGKQVSFNNWNIFTITIIY
jgi:hypothetical protein